MQFLDLLTIETDWLQQETHTLCLKEFEFWETEKAALIPLVHHF